MRIIPILLLCGCVPSTVMRDTPMVERHTEFVAVYHPHEHYHSSAAHTSSKSCSVAPIMPEDPTNENMGLYIGELAQSAGTKIPLPPKKSPNTESMGIYVAALTQADDDHCNKPADR